MNFWTNYIQVLEICVYFAKGEVRIYHLVDRYTNSSLDRLFKRWVTLFRAFWSSWEDIMPEGADNETSTAEASVLDRSA